MQGGYRNKQDLNYEAKPVLSVITIVYNGSGFIERTIKSVVNQSYKNIEYIIIDGASKDNTLEIVKRYEENIALWISEKDKGIYDAMNKGLQLAKGDYVIFMNAGDQFHNETTVKRIFTTNANADIYYGDTLIVDDEGRSLGPRRLRPPEKLTWKSFRMGMLVCHQSFIVKRTLAPLYDLNYKIAADIDWCIKCMKQAKTLENVHFYIANYLSGGASWQNQKKALNERFNIMKKHYGIVSVISSHMAIVARFAVQKIQGGKMTN
ncbi:glycosyltransferase family 2 protein [Solitalea canadensis]|uniref:Glycosyl transferase n=1 Tax=Solitalea canadensis (strain ATCC 29591 / DSM 3403 / JCM 21819 / LMG 8368 / NBRC 15130 / NCIMB 12057 / USAM 9D) TaxID=929556 RepID=H8KM65_SOLCM|nr:glycosyltransferase family 2 protein [Solitalea canadensis]AFD09247.1 glycosyl transferase [Solitalea canadensis DSM 3403]